MTRLYVFARAVAFAATATLLAGCTSSGLGGIVDKSNKNAIQVGPTEWSTDERGKPIALKGDLLTGGTLDLASLRGKVVVVNIWGSWCGPCREEAPALVTAFDQLEPQGVDFVGLDTRDTGDAARQFLSNNKETWPSLDDDGTLLLAFRGKVNPNAIPSTIVLDRQGRVAARVIGRVRTDTLTEIVATVLQEPST